MDPLLKLIRDRIENSEYQSAKFRLALIKDGEFWKILLGKIILDIRKPQANVTLLKTDSFVIEDIEISLNEFKNYLDYLERVHIAKISPEGKVTISDELLYKIGDYRLCFVGNFPSTSFDFYGRDVSSKHHGINRPIQIAGYAIHDSVVGKRPSSIDLTSSEIPFRNISEAVNFFWKTRFEEHSISNYCSVYFPTYQASIANADFDNTRLKLKCEIDEMLVKPNELSISVIATNRSGDDFRERFEVKDIIEVDFKFTPEQVNVFLAHNGKKIDEVNHYDYKDIQTLRPRVRQDYRTVDDFGLEYAPNKQSVFGEELVSKLPKEIQSLLQEADESFNAKLYRSSALLFRTVVEEGITRIIKQKGKESELYNERKFEVGLGSKIGIITEYLPSFRQIKSELDEIKWFGDKAAHESNMPIHEEDITRLTPRLRLILAKFSEELK